jgi:hypothetical protein
MVVLRKRGQPFRRAHNTIENESKSKSRETNVRFVNLRQETHLDPLSGCSVRFRCYFHWGTEVRGTRGGTAISEE